MFEIKSKSEDVVPCYLGNKQDACNHEDKNRPGANTDDRTDSSGI